MNQGVPETPVHPVHSQINTSAPVKLPNFNCLPVQVFPTFNLPANPKSLLRTRSDPRENPIQRILPSTVNTTRFDDIDTFNNNNKYTPTYLQVNNNRPVSMYEYNAPSPPAPVNTYSLPRASYGSDGYTAPVLPEISYDAEYFRTPPKVYSATEQLPKLEISEEKDELIKESVESSLDLTIKPLTAMTISTITPVTEVAKDVFIPTNVPESVETKDVNIPTFVNVPVETKDVNTSNIIPTPVETREVTIPMITSTSVETNELTIPTVTPIPIVKNEVTIPTISPTPVLTKPVEENAETENEQVQLKLLYTYYVYIYMSVYIVCYTYLLYNITEP